VAKAIEFVQAEIRRMMGDRMASLDLMLTMAPPNEARFEVDSFSWWKTMDDSFAGLIFTLAFVIL